MTECERKLGKISKSQCSVGLDVESWMPLARQCSETWIPAWQSVVVGVRSEMWLKPPTREWFKACLLTVLDQKTVSQQFNQERNRKNHETESFVAGSQWTWRRQCTSAMCRNPSGSEQLSFNMNWFLFAVRNMNSFSRFSLPIDYVPVYSANHVFSSTRRLSFSESTVFQGFIADEYQHELAVCRHQCKRHSANLLPTIKQATHLQSPAPGICAYTVFHVLPVQVHSVIGAGTSRLIRKSDIPGKIISNKPNFKLSMQISIAETGVQLP